MKTQFFFKLSDKNILDLSMNFDQLTSQDEFFPHVFLKF